MSMQNEERVRLGQKLDALAQFHSGLAHDINNQMTTLLGNLSILESMYPDKGDMFQDMTLAAETISDLIRLEQTYCKQDRMPDHAVALTGLLHGLRDLLDRTLGHEIELEWNIGDRAYYVKGDESILDQILINLFLEARIRASGSPNAVLRASLTEEDNKITFIINSSDLIPLPFPWPPREQPHSDPTEIGRGVGLALTRTLIDALGGSLTISGDANSLDIQLSLPQVDPMEL